MKNSFVVAASLLSVLLFSSSQLFAQNGEIKGKVSEVVNGQDQPIPFATVQVLGTSTGAITDINGNFTLPVNAGTYDLTISFVGYKTDTITGVEVKSNAPYVLDHKMNQSAIGIKTVTVGAKANRENKNALIKDRQEAEEVVQNIGAKEMQEKGVSNVADGLKKVAGLSVVGSGYVFVRGMGDRYNSAYLNGMPVPSPDPDKKVIPLNIFPTNVVRNITVVKSYSPKFYGDFSGGAVDIRTKEYMTEPIFQVSVGASGNTQTTFGNFNTYEGGSTDFWGMDNGARDLPPLVLASDGHYNSLNNEGQGSGFPSNWNRVSRLAPVNNNFGFLAGNYYEMGEKKQSAIGFMATANFRNGYQRNFGQLKIINAQNDVKLDYDFDKSIYSTTSSGLASVFFKLNDQHSITYDLLMSNLSTDEFADHYGQHFDYPTMVYSRRYTYRQNSLLTNHVSGEHHFADQNRLKVSWDIAINTAKNEEPDRRQLVYLYDGELPNTQFVVNSVDKLDNHRFFSDLKENETSMGAQIDYVIQYDKEETTQPVWSVTAGVQSTSKQRDFMYRIFTYDMNQISDPINYPNGVDIDNPNEFLSEENHESALYSIREATGPEAAHQATLDVFGGYVSTNFRVPGTKLNVIAGSRLESSSQFIYYRKQTDTYDGPRRQESIEATSLLPMLALKYGFSETKQLRFAASSTIARPGFRELAPFEYTEVFAGTKNVGNPTLQNGRNYNADLRYEVFPRRGELVAVTAFSKYLLNPIEKTNLATASGQLQSFQNADQAYVAGLEVEFTKRLSMLTADTNWTDHLSAGINATVLYSQVQFNEGSGVSIIQTNTERPLQGASPFLVNIDMSYEDTLFNKVKSTLTLSYNVFGRRVYAAGIQGMGDQYELPVNTLNFIWRNSINRNLGINFSFMNILNAKYRIIQETPTGPEIINNYRKGLGVGLGMSYKF